ncbi:MAG: hypothetical protein PGN15_02800 [Aeromicrobium erythreum]
MSTISAHLHVHTNPVSDADAERFNTWYDEVHVPQVVERVDGIVAARRYELASAQLAPAEALPAHRYLAVYDIASDDVGAVLGALATALGDGTLDPSDAMDLASNPPSMVVYAPR